MANVTINTTQLLGEIKTVVADAQKLLTLAEKYEAFIPAADQAYVTEAQNVLTFVESVISVLGV